MKKGTKIILIVLGCVLAIGIAFFVTADVLLSRFLTREVNDALSRLPGCEASVGDIDLRFFSGTADVTDLQFSFRGAPLSEKDTVCPGVIAHVDRIAVGRILYSLLLDKQVYITDVRIIRPSVELWLDEQHPELSFPQLQDTTLAKSGEWLKRAELDKLRIKNAVFSLHSLSSKLDLAADSVGLTVHDLVYDSVFHYNDSVYRLSLGTARVMMPDGMMHLETSGIEHESQGVLHVGRTRICHTMGRKKLGDIVREPVTWMDMTIESVTTAPLNPIRKAMDKDYNLDHLTAVVEKMDIFRDERYAPKRPFDMPQKILTSLPVVFCIKHVDAGIRNIDIEFASTNVNCGRLKLRDIRTRVDNVTNRRGATLYVNGGCPISKQGHATAKMSMSMDKACHWMLDLHATSVDIDYLNTFVRPLVGITAECRIDTLDTRYTGDSQIAKGTFRMLYHGLKVKVHEEDDIPYKIVTKNAKTFTTLANSLIPHSNPTAVDIRPRAYAVEWKNDVWKPFPLYMFGPCIDGIKDTFLPGLYVHKQVRK